MAVSIVAQKTKFSEFTRDEWICYAFEFLEMRRGLAGADPGESLVGYVGQFSPVYVYPGKKIEGETWYCWLIFPGEGRLDRVVNQVVPGTYIDAQDGTIYEHDPAWVLVLGSVSRIGDLPLLSPEMLRGDR